ncbi:hypothetical protein NQ314_001541 [Rhamnusium bicolor]|uniref:MSP domain-containing protein n=1 Tax=Rhamnusium bicolor TaxID=1586634 RepID=A0AAV8ZSC6_9CUCU|nr:hypothetical protein NQ314_001541 [Rhamnusium bicolor]
MEDASIHLTPGSLHLNYLKLNETYNYELNIKNNSRHLPIIIKYNKETCIEIKPREVHLGPNSSIEVCLTIKPSKIGQSFHKIVFDLVYQSANIYYDVGAAYLPVYYFASITTPKIQPKFNMGITPKITNEVGFLVDDVRFNTIIDKPIQAIVDKNFKNFNINNEDLIAFPNDRPKSLRPWRNTVPSRTIYANLPRLTNGPDEEYTLNTAEFQKKQVLKNVYSTYIQSAAKARQKKRRCYDESAAFKSSPNNFHTFIPLPPEKLMSVSVTPKYVRLGKIAPYTSCTNFFTIENKNEFPINVSIKALNNSVVIKEKKRMLIGPKITKNIFFDCYSHGLGKYYVPVFIIVNHCHIFDATVFAKVVPTTVKCNLKDITIDPITNETFFEIFNPVNCDISFSWEVQDKNFVVIPESGTIPFRRGIFCRIIFIPQLQAVFKTEIYLISQSGAKQVFTVSLENSKASVGFHTYLVKFDNIPLNMPVNKEVVLRNFSDVKIMYLISNPNPLEEITIKPTEGKINAKSDIHFQITAHFKNVVEFNCSIQFILQDVHKYSVNITGNVIFPRIKLEPEFIQIHKIISGAYIRRVFRVTNISETQSFINFPLEDIPEFFITDMDKNNINTVIALEPNESKELFLEFKPTEPIAYSIFLPYILNGIIGPPALNDPLSLNPMIYFKDKITDSILKIAVTLPDTLSTLSIRCAAGPPWLIFSSLHLYLFSFSNKRKKHFTITNISNTEHQLTIPLIDAEYPFSFKLEKKSYQINNGVCEVCIEQEEMVTFTVEFNPTEYGQYEIELPIFVDKYFEKCPFNF